MLRDSTYSPPRQRRRTTRRSHESPRSSQMPSTPASFTTISSSTSSSIPSNSAVAMLRSRLRARNIHRTPSPSASTRHVSPSGDINLDDEDEQRLSIFASIESRLSVARETATTPVSPRTAMVTAQAFELRNRKWWVVESILGRRDGMTWVRWEKVRVPGHIVNFDKRTGLRPFVSLNRKRYYFTPYSTGEIDKHGKASWLVRWEDEWLDDSLMGLWVNVSNSSSPVRDSRPQSIQHATSVAPSHTLSLHAGGSSMHINDNADSDSELWNDIDDVFHSLPSSSPGFGKGMASSVTLRPETSTPPTEDNEVVQLQSKDSTPSTSTSATGPLNLIIPGEYGVEYGMVELVRQAIESRTTNKLFGQQGELRPTLAQWLRHNHPPRRTVMFAKNFERRRMKFNLSDYRKAEAVLVHEIGEEVVPCDSCREGKGPLEGCVIMNHFDKGACTCCRANKTSHKCNFHQRYAGHNPRAAVPLSGAPLAESTTNEHELSTNAGVPSALGPASSDDSRSTADGFRSSSTTSSNPRKRSFDALMSGRLGSDPAEAGQGSSRPLPGFSPPVLGTRQDSAPYPPSRPRLPRQIGLPTPTSALPFRSTLPRRSEQTEVATGTVPQGRSSPIVAKQERSNSVRRASSEATSTAIARWIHIYENNFGVENQKLIANEFRHAWHGDFGQSGEPDINKMPAYFCFGAGAKWFQDMAMPLAWSKGPKAKASIGLTIVLE